MKFTVIFNSTEGTDYTYGLLFTPCPVWVQGEKDILNLNPRNPNYKLGSIKKLLIAEKIENKLLSRNCILVVHNCGYGTEEDYKNITEDLKNEDFKFTVVDL